MTRFRSPDQRFSPASSDTFGHRCCLLFAFSVHSWRVRTISFGPREAQRWCHQSLSSHLQHTDAALAAASLLMLGDYRKHGRDAGPDLQTSKPSVGPSGSLQILWYVFQRATRASVRTNGANSLKLPHQSMTR